MKPTFYEFFAGGGMARAGLGDSWNCLFANDNDVRKAAAYAKNWGALNIRCADVRTLTTWDLPGRADLAWASFPCQDLSLAGAYKGLQGERSGTFWPFWRLMESLRLENRAPAVIVLENVCGALTSHAGKDFATLTGAIVESGYRIGALVIDAVHFVPQSRPRLFLVAVATSKTAPPQLTGSGPGAFGHPETLITAYRSLPRSVRSGWVWWRIPPPPVRQVRFADILEDTPRGVAWHAAAETERLLGMMSPRNRAKVELARAEKRRVVGTIYRRTRAGTDGLRVQRAEIRLDDVAGCLRTPAGGLSRQSIMIIEGDHVKSRLLSPREAARLMGLPDTYTLPENYNEAYHLAGDGVVVPVVRHLAANLLEPLVAGSTENDKEAA